MRGEPVRERRDEAHEPSWIHSSPKPEKEKLAQSVRLDLLFFSLLSSPFARPRSDYFSVDPMTLAFNVSLVLVPPKAAVLSSAPTPRESN